MANEARIVSSLTINSGNLQYVSRPAAFSADVSVANGPTPGAVSCSVNGTDVSFAALARPGLCWVQNLDETNFVTVGVYEPGTGVFYPLLELLPGEGYTIRLSRSVNEQYAGTVTGTGSDAPNNSVRIKADTAACNVRVEAFDA